MAVWHLEGLRRALEGRGWSVIAEHPGDGHRTSGTWEIQRSTRRPPLWLDFDGLDEGGCLPMPEAYGFRLRSSPAVLLYFRKRRSLNLCREQLAAFAATLDAA